MYFRAVLIVLSTCVLCLIILMHFKFLDESEDDVPASFNFSCSNSFKQEEIQGNFTSWSTSSENRTSSSIIMGDERRNSSQSDQSSGDNCTLKDHFDIVQLSKHLNLCIRKKDNEVDFKEYICVFQQLYKFFIMLGSVFGFVGSDVKTKLEILQGYATGENRTHYETVEQMIQFEKTTDFINKNKESSGSRTLLRLHRALNFVSKFLGKVDEIKDSDGTAHVCKEAYTQTLSKFHPWLIQKGALLAMYALPSKKDLISRVCDGRIETSEVRRLLHEVIASTQRVYDQCENIYRENDMLDLP